MAGLGRKVFAAGEVLTAANVQGYLQDQAVMVFDDDADRTASLGTAVSEGMVSYLKDIDTLQVYGTAWENVSNPADITGVAAGTALTGGGTAGDVTLNVDIAAVGSAVQINNTQIDSTVTDIGTATYTILGSDAGKYLRFTTAATVTVSSATDFEVGQQVQIFGDGTALSITTDGATIAGVGVTTTSGTFTLASQYTALSVFCVGTDNYRIIGNIETV